MAHLQKFNIQNYDWVIAHCERTLTGEHESHSVDSSLSYKNYQIDNNNWKSKSGYVKPKEVVDGLIYRHGLRKNGVCLSSFVIQPTDDVKPDDYGKFFDNVSHFMYKRYGNNFISSYIHYDEPNAKPHSHNLLVPIKDNKFRAREIYTKKDLLSFHKDLSDYLTEKLGYRVNMLNGATIRGADGKAISVSKYNSLKYENEQLQAKLNDISAFEIARKQVLKDTDKNSYNALLSAEKKVLSGKEPFVKRVIGWLSSIFHKKAEPHKQEITK